MSAFTQVILTLAMSLLLLLLYSIVVVGFTPLTYLDLILLLPILSLLIFLEVRDRRRR